MKHLCELAHMRDIPARNILVKRLAELKHRVHKHISCGSGTNIGPIQCHSTIVECLGIVEHIVEVINLVDIPGRNILIKSNGIPEHSS